MKTKWFNTLLTVLLLALPLAVSLTGAAVARPALPEAGMAKKHSATMDVAGYDEQHGPHSQFEFTTQ